MSLRIRHVRIRADTSKGLYGADLRFDDGLVILEARNSSGKSTVLMSVLYALGLEGMLASYGFRSFPIGEIRISPRSFRPIRDGADLWGMSASDTIRVIWAYLIGLLEVARSENTNHLGLLIFDEPRQQSTDKVSFAALLSRATKSLSAGQQVIFATSEDQADLQALSPELAYQLIVLPPRVLQPIGNDGSSLPAPAQSPR